MWPLSIIFERSLILGEMPDVQKKPHHCYLHPREMQAKQLCLRSREAVEKILLEIISSHKKITKVIGSSQDRLFKGKSCLTNLASADEMPGSEVKGRARSQALGLKNLYKAQHFLCTA